MNRVFCTLFKRDSRAKAMSTDMNETLNLNTTDDCTILPSQLNFYFEWQNQPQAKRAIDSAVEHVTQVWREVKKEYHTYRCVQSLSFLVPKVQRFEAYPKLLDLLVTQKKVKVADIGCCFGQDIRRLILDGIPPDMIYAIDVTPGYWQAGLRLYNDKERNNHDIASVKTLFCDLCAEEEEGGDVLEPASFDCIILKNVFHVLSFVQATRLIHRMAKMLRPGGFVMGICVGSEIGREWALTPDGQERRYLHSVESLSKLFTAANFTPASVRPLPIIVQSTHLPPFYVCLNGHLNLFLIM